MNSKKCDHKDVLYKDVVNKEGNPCKVAVCSCGEIVDIIVKDMAKKLNPIDSKDRRIARMSVLKTATDLVSQSKLNLSDGITYVKQTAEELEKWIYRD